MDVDYTYEDMLEMESYIQEAVDAVGISRSSFYKYKDAVRPFNDMLHGRIVTIQVMLRDEPGVLSGVLNLFADTGINVLTINQKMGMRLESIIKLREEEAAAGDMTLFDLMEQLSDPNN